jgi:hypothetical protein
LQKELVTAPIVGATKVTHLEDAVEALALKLTPEDVAYLEEPYAPQAVVGPPVISDSAAERTHMPMCSMWTSDELNRIGSAEEVRIATTRPDGTLRKPVIGGLVRHGDDLYEG